MKFFAACILFMGAASLHAQTPTVPDQIQFAGMELTIRDDAKRDIQKDVNMLTQHNGYFAVKTDRAKLYFPIIEKIFVEAGVPTDFKFLALQESSLVADAVSTSNAVGFWQFKDFTAMEMGLRVDERIDERMNVVAATQGAAKYLAKNNIQFNNWLYTLQSYQMGAGGVKRAVPDLQNGATSMEITSDTYWYVKRFLAHKIAFENGVGGEAEMKLIPYQTAQQKSLKEIATELSVEESILKEYNKWLKTDFIPNDKEYVVVVPVGKLNKDFNRLFLPSPVKEEKLIAPPTETVDSVFQINGIAALKAKKGETLEQLATRGNVPLEQFLKYNEIENSFVAKEGMFFLLAKKKNSAQSEYHKTKAGDDLWSISQQYGIKVQKLRKYNPPLTDGTLLANEIVWLGSKRPPIQELKMENGQEVAQLDKAETFEWVNVATPSQKNVVVDSVFAKPSQKIIAIDSISPIKIVAEHVIQAASHTVLPKETLYSIANQYHVKIIDLLQWNTLSIHDKLKPGQVLLLMEPATTKMDSSRASTSQSIAFHEVKSSDTLYSIARQYGITIRNIMEWNNKKDFSLSEGERLQIRER